MELSDDRRAAFTRIFWRFGLFGAAGVPLLLVPQPARRLCGPRSSRLICPPLDHAAQVAAYLYRETVYLSLFFGLLVALIVTAILLRWSGVHPGRAGRRGSYAGLVVALLLVVNTVGVQRARSWSRGFSGSRYQTSRSVTVRSWWTAGG